MWRGVTLVLVAAVSPCVAQQAEVALVRPRFLHGSGLDARPIDPAGGLKRKKT